MSETSITPQALSNALRHALSSTNAEVIGLLVGKLKDGKLLITDAIPSPHKHATSVSVSLIDEFQAVVAEKLMREGRNEYIVGIFHSHPGFGCFLSDTDMTTQQGIQQMFPQAVAMVIDPLQPGNVNYKFFRVVGSNAVEIPSRVLSGEFQSVQDVQVTEASRWISSIKVPNLTGYFASAALIFSLVALVVSGIVYYKVSMQEGQIIVDTKNGSTENFIQPAPSNTFGTVTTVALSSGYLFSWNEVPGKDELKLKEFLIQNYNANWVEKATIKKIDANTINISAENKFVLLKLNDERTKVNLTIDGRIDEFIAKDGR